MLLMHDARFDAHFLARLRRSRAAIGLLSARVALGGLLMISAPLKGRTF